MAERNADAVVGAFAAVAGGARWVYAGALTFADAGAVLAAAQALPLPREGVVDCAGIVAIDSAAVAVLLALKRRAAAEGRPVTFAHVPPALAALAALYGVDTLLAG
jgi:phospholipid transport system transporter-binding protein